MRRTKLSMTATDAYFELVKEFPLRSIKSRAQHQAAIGFLSSLISRGAEKDHGAVEYMRTLAQLVEDYERDAGLKLDTSKVTPRQILRHLMDEHNLTVTALGKIVGSQGTLSDVLAGRRELSKAMIRKLADHFGVSPAVFL